MKKKIILFYFLSLITLAGCSKKEAKNENAINVGSKPNIIVDSSGVEGFDISTSSENEKKPDEKSNADNDVIEVPFKIGNKEIVPQGEVKYDKEDDIFGLTEKEIKAYEEFSKNFDKNILKELEPLSILKLWVQAGVAKAWESEFELYEPESVAAFPKKDFYNLHLEDMEMESLITRRQMAEFNFMNAPQAKWVVDDETHGHLIYKTDYAGWLKKNGDNLPPEVITDYEEVTLGIHFVKNEDGIWLLDYYPVSSLAPEE